MIKPSTYQAFDASLRGVNCKLPPLSCDCHFHVFENFDRFPFQEPRSYTPTPAPLDSYRKLMSAYGIERAVYIQPSVYGADHAMMENLLADHRSWLRAVAVVFPDTPEKDLLRWSDLGVRGARCNALFKGGISTNEIRLIAERVRALDWHIQLCTDISQEPDLVGSVAATGITVVVDHFGHFPISTARHDKGFANLLAALREGNTWVKLSGPYRVSSQRTDFSDCQWAAEQLILANPDRIVWGSDWPHPAISERMVNDGDLIEALVSWVGETLLEKVLVTNPARLYWTT